jgi:hypothetical protein
MSTLRKGKLILCTCSNCVTKVTPHPHQPTKIPGQYLTPNVQKKHLEADTNKSRALNDEVPLDLPSAVFAATVTRGAEPDPVVSSRSHFATEVQFEQSVPEDAPAPPTLSNTGEGVREEHQTNEIGKQR